MFKTHHLLCQYCRNKITTKQLAISTYSTPDSEPDKVQRFLRVSLFFNFLKARAGLIPA